jgi:hypothetical protein
MISSLGDGMKPAGAAKPEIIDESSESILPDKCFHGLPD